MHQLTNHAPFLGTFDVSTVNSKKIDAVDAEMERMKSRGKVRSIGFANLLEKRAALWDGQQALNEAISDYQRAFNLHQALASPAVYPRGCALRLASLFTRNYDEKSAREWKEKAAALAPKEEHSSWYWLVWSEDIRLTPVADQQVIDVPDTRDERDLEPP